MSTTATLITLPISEETVPESEYKLVNVKTLQGRETYCFTADIKRGSKTIGDARNDGNGGNNIVFIVPEEREAFEAYIEQWPAWTSPFQKDPIKVDEDYAITVLVHEIIEGRLVRRDAKKKLVVKLPSSDTSAGGTVTVTNRTYESPDAVAITLEQSPEAAYWNPAEDRWVRPAK